MRHLLDFEQPIHDMEVAIEAYRKKGIEQNVDNSASLALMQEDLLAQKKEIFSKLTPWQKVQLSRHPDRPYTLDYIEAMTTDFVEIHGDRQFGDDKAIVGGFARLDDTPVMILGQQKGRNTRDRQFRNFGMPNPEGYRKALRMMKMAEKFNRPIITLIDTPGAFPGLEAEERGQGEAIARNLREMFMLTVPVICIVIGEGASGGALGIAIGDRVMMLENTWYSVISPESCSSILWRSWNFKEQAASALKLTSKDMKANGLVDAVIPEPFGGAHLDPELMAATLKRVILNTLADLNKRSPEERIDARIEKFSGMGVFNE